MHAHPMGSLLLAATLCLSRALIGAPTAHAAWAHSLSPRQAPRLQVTVTAYSGNGTTASGRRVRPGMVALSRDVARALGVTFGQPVVLEGFGTFVFADRMAARHRRRADIFMASPRAARRFGVTGAQVRGVGPPRRGCHASHAADARRGACGPQRPRGTRALRGALRARGAWARGRPVEQDVRARGGARAHAARRRAAL